MVSFLGPGSSENRGHYSHAHSADAADEDLPSVIETVWSSQGDVVKLYLLDPRLRWLVSCDYYLLEGWAGHDLGAVRVGNANRLVNSNLLAVIRIDYC